MRNETYQNTYIQTLDVFEIDRVCIVYQNRSISNFETLECHLGGRAK